MTGEPIITVVGNLTGAPELKFVPSGAAVANFTVASNPRTFNKQSNEWVDGEPLFMRCAVWREQAEQVAESLQTGMRVIVTGRLVSRSWDDKDSGQKRTVMEMQVDEVGPSLKYATAQVAKVQKGQQGGGQQGGDQYGGDFTGHQQPQGQGGWQNPQQGAPQWGQQPQQGGNSGPLQPAQQQQPPQGGGGWQQAPQGQQPPQAQQQANSQWGQQPSYDEPPF